MKHDDWVQIGSVAVDSGEILITDSCYKKQMEKSLVTVFKPGIGDGVYPVYALIKTHKLFGKRIYAVRIDFMED